MQRDRLRQLLSTALLSSLVAPLAACGGVVIVDPTATADGGTGDARDDAGDGAACAPIVRTDTCNETVTYPCGLPIIVGGSPTGEECAALCAPVAEVTGRPSMSWCYVYGDDAGTARQVNCASCAVGRRPADLLDAPAGDVCDPIAAALADMARIEAASVHAFRRLEDTLAALDAPRELRARARAAARDEIRHARLVTKLARARGTSPARVTLDPDAAKPTAFDLALENAVEGCVHETLGVAYLAHQAQHAADAELRALAEALYEEELDHASLSWDLSSFFDARLDDDQRLRLRAAQERALVDVVHEAARIHPEVRAAFGIPTAQTVARMVEALRGTLFADRAHEVPAAA